MDKEVLTGYTFGAMVAPEDFMRPGYEQIVSFYCVLTDKPWRQLSKDYRRQRSAGRYIVTYFAGDYMATAEAYSRLRAYMQAHHLRPADFAYEESLIEDMSTANPQDFLTRIAVPVAEEKY
jgi:effector-binding domain-containing protein